MKTSDYTIYSIKSEKLELPKKVSASDVDSLVSELFAEEKEANFKALKDELRSLLKKHVEMGVEINKKRKELESLEQQKQKEFIDAANKLFARIDGIGELEAAYAKSLSTAVSGEVKTE